MSSYRYSSDAHADIERIVLYIFELNPVAANSFLDHLEQTCQLLAQHALLGRPRPQLGNGIRSFPVGNYLVFYIPTPDGIDVARVIYAEGICPRPFTAKGPKIPMKLFYTGPAINTEMLVVMLEKHGITATEKFVDPAGDPDDLNRQAKVFVPEADYDRAHQLFYAEREDEL